jgi:hypothetical protein
MIASATQSSDPGTAGDVLRAGAHYKESGYFVAPQLGFGRRLRRFDLRVVGKQVWHLGGQSLGAFDGFYAGVSIARING